MTTRPLVPVDASDFGQVVATLGYVLTLLPQNEEVEDLLQGMLDLTDKLENQLKPFVVGTF